ncbi:iron-sulfur cluster assembly protein [Pseudarthrobacter sp. LT1]|uniref:iron-sulfur cluster assembly protein n=1 Tax=Pseudarthrobacter sp. LT1 TaxID=3111450 RepID=UPI002D7A2539|nr:iron-sulfur cluster assembly protein [Pseudarthrobacter sp. LT1]WRT15007.1 iron-sulfur cluster assembly protein [Pseudarthrobacter sp. LT1]
MTAALTERAVSDARVRSVAVEDIRQALAAVLDPELDEPITDLGFVRSIEVTRAADGTEVTVHLRLPTSFCSPNFAYLMASDSKDAIAPLPGVVRVVVELDDHHDSALINAGLAADAGYRGTFGHEAEDSLDGLRLMFRRKAHTAAMERCLTEQLRTDPALTEANVGTAQLGDLPAGRTKDALVRRRMALGLPTEPAAVVLVDHDGRPYPAEQVPMALRRARSTRISIDGNAHFCRGLLRTRYEGSGADQTDRPEGAEAADHHHLLPFTVKETHP